VRGTVRSEDKGEWLKAKFDKEFGKGVFEYVIVEDLEKPNGFDEAVKGVDGIAHTASPFHFKVTDPQKDLIDPAVNGTTGVLKSALKANQEGSKIKRIVITSSFAAILNPYPPVYTFTEKDWNTFSIEEFEKKGKNIDPMNAYRASKTLAERAAWDFVEANSLATDPLLSGNIFDIATINPPFVLGPIIHQCSSPQSINTSIASFYQLIVTHEKDAATATQPGGNWVDVRDVALAHVEALVRPQAGGERFAIAVGPYTFQDFLDALHSSPALKALRAKWPEQIAKVPVGSPGAGKENLTRQNILSAEKAKTILGIQCRGVEESVGDMAESLWEREAEWSK